jgi:hypothetical protein
VFAIQTIEHQRPSSIHHGRLNNFIVRNPSVRFQNERKPPASPERQVGALALPDGTDEPTRASEGFIKQFMTMVT